MKFLDKNSIPFSLSLLALSFIHTAESKEQENNLQLEEVIVVADKTEQNSQEVAVAISAIDGSQLEQLNINNSFDLSDKVPGLVVTSVQGYRPTISIRGVGNEIPDNAGTKQAVAYHMDGIFMTNDYAILADLIDVQQVVVVRGPDGTVFGNSSTGGAVNIVTEKPQLEQFYGYVDMGVGNFSATTAKAMLNLPLSDTAALRFSASHREQDGYTENLYFDDFQLDDKNNQTGKLQLLWQPTDTFSMRLQTQAFTSDTNGPGLKGGVDTISEDPRVVYHDTAESYKLDTDFTSVHLDWETSFANLKAIASRQNYDMSRVLDFDRSSLTANDPAPFPLQGTLDLLLEAPIPQFIGTLRQEDTSSTFEINLSSLADNKTPWIVGAFFLDTEIFSNTRNFFDADRDGEPVSLVVQGPNVFANNSDIDFINSDFRNFESFSVFGQINFSINEKLGLTTGLRYTENSFNDERCSFNCVPTRSPISSNPANETDNVTGKVALEYQVSDISLLYASIATGVKPAGSNSSSDTRFFPEVFDRETVTAYQVGSKNDLFNNTLRINVAGFYYDYEDYLFESSGVSRFAAGASNLPEAEIYGFEIEGDYIISESLDLSFNMTVMDSEILTGRDAIDRAEAENASVGLIISGAPSEEINAAREATAVSLTGNELAKIPDMVFNLNLTHSFYFDQGHKLFSSFGYRYRGEYFSRVFNSTERDLVDSYSSLDLNFKYVPVDSDWEFKLNVQNLLDEDAIASRTTDTFGLGFTSNQYLPPRSILVSARYHF